VLITYRGRPRARLSPPSPPLPAPHTPRTFP
jgi:hypothetical protein